VRAGVREDVGVSVSEGESNGEAAIVSVTGISLGVEPQIVTSGGGARIRCCQCGVLFDNRSRVCG